MKKNKYKTLAIAAAFVVFFAVMCSVFNTGYRIAYPIKCRELVEKYSAEYGLEPELLFAVIRTESGFDPNAVSSADARGLMQMTPDTFDWLKLKLNEDLPTEALFDEETAIRYGGYFLHILLEEFNNTDTAIAAYHAGRGKVNEWLDDREISPDGVVLKRIPYKDTEYYVHKIEKAVEAYKKIYEPETERIDTI